MDGLISVQELFGSRAFRIPPYQRGYSWERRQWDDLIEDLEVLPQGKDHFTGQVVLQPTDSQLVDTEGAQYRIYDVVDGQQRLTTLVLLMEAMRRRASDGLANGIEKRFIRITDRAHQPQTKLRFTDGSQGFFESNVLAAQPAPGGATTRAEHRLRACREYFDAYLERASNERGDAFDGWLQGLHDRVSHHLKVNTFEVADPGEVGLIFEVLNSRGRPLSELDLVKNYVLYVGTKLDLEHALHDDVAGAWTQVLTTLMNAGVSGPGDEDALLRAHWLMTYDPLRKNWQGSRTVKERFRLREYANAHEALLTDLRSYVGGLRHAALPFADIHNPTRAGSFSDMTGAARNRVIRTSDRLHRTRAIAVFVPLLIATRVACPGDADRYLEMVDLAERYAFRVYRLIGRRADAGEAMLTRLAYELGRGERDFGSVVAEFKRTLLSYCSESDFAEAFADERENDCYHWSGIKYFLFEYEQHLVGDDEVQIAWQQVERADREKTIEHILPQTPTNPYWTARFDDEALERYTHDLGNLVLTADNRSYGNRAFPQKRGSLTAEGPCYAQANLQSEREIAAWEEWTVQSIRERRQALASWAVERWKVEAPPETSYESLQRIAEVESTDELDDGDQLDVNEPTDPHD